MIIIGIDPHKSTHTATALDPVTNSEVGTLRIEASVFDYRRLMTWAKAWPQRRWAIENAQGLGHHVAQWLLALGEEVVDIPTTATARVRELSRGGGRKNDRIDAAAAASVAALQGDARPVRAESTADSLALLDERRVNLSQSRTRAINQLHALLRELMAGGAPTSLTAATASKVLSGFRPRTATDRVRVALAKDSIADIRRLDQQLAASIASITAILDEHGTRLRETDGVGPVLAARLLGRTGTPSRFASEASYANYTGSGGLLWTRRPGNFPLNSQVTSLSVERNFCVGPSHRCPLCIISSAIPTAPAILLSDSGKFDCHLCFFAGTAERSGSRGNLEKRGSCHESYRAS